MEKTDYWVQTAPNRSVGMLNVYGAPANFRRANRVSCAFFRKASLAWREVKRMPSLFSEVGKGRVRRPRGLIDNRSFGGRFAGEICSARAKMSIHPTTHKIITYSCCVDGRGQCGCPDSEVIGRRTPLRASWAEGSETEERRAKPGSRRSRKAS